MGWKEEYLRKAIHVGSLSIPVLYLFLTRRWTLCIVVPIAVLSLAVDIARLRDVRLSNAFLKLFGPLLREHEGRTLTGASHVLVSSSLCVLLFDKPIAILSLLFLILGDPAAALIGRQHGGKRLWGGKSVPGSLACLVVCLGVALLAPAIPVWPAFPAMPISVRVLGPLTATLVEFLPLPVDDNLSIPLVSGLVMQVML